MLTVNRVSKAELEAQAHRQYRKLMGIPDDAPVPAPEPVSVVNAAEAVTIGDAAGFFYRGRRFVLPPIPWRDGIRLFEIQLSIVRAAQGKEQTSTEDLMAGIEEALSICARLSRPASFARFIPRGIRPNPFRNASEQEIGELLDFFYRRRTRPTSRTSPSSGVGAAGRRR